MSSKTIKLNDGTSAVLKTEPLPPGDEGVIKTLALMVKLALDCVSDPLIQQRAKELKGGTDVATISNIFRYVVKTFPYVKEPEEVLTAPRHLIKKNAPYAYLDCDDLSMLLASLLIAAGFRVQYAVIAWRRPEYTHVFVRVYVPSAREWRPLDAVMGEKGLFNQRPAKYRQTNVDVVRGEIPALNDGEESPSVDWQALAKELITGTIAGKNPAEILKEKVADICVDGFKQKIKDNKGKVIAGCIAGVLVIGAGGYGVGKVIEKQRK